MQPAAVQPSVSAVSHSAITSLNGASASNDTSGSSELRDPRAANAVTHAGFSKAQQSRSTAELSFAEWTESFAGRVEEVKPNRLYIVKLEDADGEFRLGLIATDGAVFDKEDEESGEETPHVRALWFKRCSDSKHAWGANPEFEMYMDCLLYTSPSPRDS